MIPRQQQGVLGARPHQSFNVSAPSSYAPTDIEQAMHTLSVQPPDDQNWYMDTAATSHMTANQGTLSSYFKLSKNNGITVGNGNIIPIHGYGSASLTHSHPSLNLKNVLYAQLLISSRTLFRCVNLLMIIWFLLNLIRLGFL